MGKTFSQKTWTNRLLITWQCWPAAGQSVLVDHRRAWLASLRKRWQSAKCGASYGHASIILFIWTNQIHTASLYLHHRVITPALVLFVQKSLLSVTVQLNCYTGLKISTFKWNWLCDEAKHVKAKPPTAYKPDTSPILASTLHDLHLPLLSKGKRSFDFVLCSKSH